MIRTVSGLTAIVIALAALGSSTAEAHPRRRCIDPDPTLGRQTCTRFGSWSLVTRLPALSMGVLAQATSQPPPQSLPMVAARGGPVPERTDDATLVGPGLRFTVGLGNTWYGGFEVSAAFAPREPTMALGGIRAVAGARTWFGDSTLSVEMAPGVGLLSSEAGMERRVDLDIRLRADRWLSPWVTFGAYVGGDPLVRDRSAGVLFAFHVRAFDGGR